MHVAILQHETVNRSSAALKAWIEFSVKTDDLKRA